MFIIPRRGLYQTTICSQCSHVFRSPESDIGLVTIRNANGFKELIDYTTQKIYPFPKICPVCSNSKLVSLYSGAEDLVEKIEEHLHIQVKKLFDTKFKGETSRTETYLPEYKTYLDTISVSTRIYDPEIDYQEYHTIIIIQAENLTASADYLVLEEVYKQMFTLLTTLLSTQLLIIDTAQLDSPIIQSLIQAQEDVGVSYANFLNTESANRKQFGLPPDFSIVLFTSQETKQDLALKKIQTVRTSLVKYIDLGFEMSSPYPAKLLRRKNMYSYHLCLKLNRKNPHFAKLRIILLDYAKQLNLQIRLNPKHIL